MEAVTSRDVLPALGPDSIVQLRHWASDEAFVLPPASGVPITIGAAPTCTWRLRDTAGYLSRLHAELIPDAGRWLLRDRGSKNGVRFDGQLRREMVLEPGVELGLGGVWLVAESLRTIALRCYLERLLGWERARKVDIDLALRSIRLASSRRAALVLCGDDDLVACARTLHEMGADERAPFVVADPRRRRVGATARSAANLDRACDAAIAAAGGTLCLMARRLPADITAALSQLQSPVARIQLVVCGGVPVAIRELCCTVIAIPSLSTRETELDRIIDEYAADAAALHAGEATLTRADRDWVRRHSAGSHAELAKGIRRLLAMRATGSVARAADLLGITHASLGEWISRRRTTGRLAGDGLIQESDKPINSDAEAANDLVNQKKSNRVTP